MTELTGHELVGERRTGERRSPERRVGRMAAADLTPLWLKVTSGIVKRGFVIEYRDLEPPRTGVFDGLRITLDPDVDFEMQCFILLHLFGHSVQWVAPSLEAKLHDLQNESDKEKFLDVLHKYEYEAARFGLQLLYEVGATGYDEWFSDFVATDWRYVERYYREDAIPPWSECLVEDGPRVEPSPIPELVHKQVAVRFAF
ncbi:MAG TPA: hypothetical protein VGE52_20425 [Pirellulales bacterium]